VTEIAQPRKQKTSHRNAIALVGEVSATASERTLPSGLSVLSWRLMVRRTFVFPGGPTFDAIDCVAWQAAVCNKVALWGIGDLVSCEGFLRRRFWRSERGTVSRCEVEVHSCRRMRQAKPRVDEPEPASAAPD
jgi:single-strand DNA-binding protein